MVGKNSSNIFVALMCVSITSCVVLTPKNYEIQKSQQALKDEKAEVYTLLRDKNMLYDTCGLTSLLKIISINMHKIENVKVDEYRINIVKDDLIKQFKEYQFSSAKKISENDLQARLNCYLDYMLNPKYEFVSFFEFWRSSKYLEYPCK